MVDCFLGKFHHVYNTYTPNLIAISSIIMSLSMWLLPLQSMGNYFSMTPAEAFPGSHGLYRVTQSPGTEPIRLGMVLRTVNLYA